MTVPLLFALIGVVILVGFLANLLFRVTKIPSVLVLIAIGVVLGPVTGWIQHDALLTIAPFFGALALLVILFEGGLELEIGHVVRHAPRTAMFTAAVFGLSLVVVAGVAHFAVGLPVSLSLMLGAVLGATSPAICMPVVSGLSVRDDVKTVIKLESVIGEVLLIVSVVLLIQSHQAGTTGAASWLWGIGRSLFVALIVASVAGALWARLVGWIGREPLSYMLTLGVTCLLYFVVEELGGSPAIAVLLFGLLLANMQFIASRIGPRVSALFSIDVRGEQFILERFVVNITAELSFLLRTFFFVYLGLLLDFSALSWKLGASIAVMYVLLLASRRAGIALFRRSGASFSDGEWKAVMALQPRGLATSVVAFMPVEAGIEGASVFPLFAFATIVLSNLYMTGGVLFAERRLRADAQSVEDEPPAEAAAPAEDDLLEPAPTSGFGAAASPAVEPLFWPRRAAVYSPARDFEDEPAPTNFTDWVARVFGLRLADREKDYVDMIRASYLSEPLFWIQAALGAAICALGLILGQTTIVVGAALIVPVARPVIAAGLALASGDLYLLAKLLVKLVVFSVLTVIVSATLIGALPFAAASEIVTRTRPTILDFLVALFGGMSAAALVSRRHGQSIQYLPGAVVGITLLPALCVVGFALTDVVGVDVLQRATLQFSANLFAAVLGAALLLLAVGIPRAAQSASVRQWKEEELAAPFASAIFRKLGLERAIGRTGSARARVIVVSVFLLLLVTPLQLALNQVRSELRTRQAIATAQEAFNVPNRSVLLGSTVSIADEQVNVRLQVATSELFSAADIANFEQRVSDRTGRRARLDLVQTLSDVGNAGALRRLLADEQRGGAAETRRTVFESLRDAEGQVSLALRGLPLPDGVQIVSVRSAMGEGTEPSLTLVYLSGHPLSPDAEELLARLVAAQTRLNQDHVSTEWMPAMFELNFSRAGDLGADAVATLRDVRAAIAAHPSLQVSLSLPEGLLLNVSGAVAKRVQEELGISSLQKESGEPSGNRTTAIVRIRKP
ncbi:MAG TPA: cation:proton antiporter [Terriglobia bacterium]|nr:cation:proton antiporter [Terriglobia bacterium]